MGSPHFNVLFPDRALLLLLAVNGVHYFASFWKRPADCQILKLHAM